MALTTVNPGLLDNNAQYTGFKNRIINGAMMIDQRNAGASVTPTNTVYTLDRWQDSQTVAGKFTVQQSSIAPAGFVNSLLCTSTSAYSLAAGEFVSIRQLIEGLNVADLAWGTADAKTVTLSFWVRSSLTGTFGGSIFNSAGNRIYVYSYQINNANTWEQKTITIAGDTTGTWLTTNGVGIAVRFCIGAASDYQGTPGSWGTTVYTGPTGQTNLVGTNGATFYITGVQLEKGSVATSFDYRPYGTELALCQRYFQAASSTSGIGLNTIGILWPYCTKVTMRSAPVISISHNGTANQIRRTSDGIVCAAQSTIAQSNDANSCQYFYASSGFSPAISQGTGYDFSASFSAEL